MLFSGGYDVANETYYSDREFGPRPRVEEEVSHSAWGGIAALINKLIRDGWFGGEYPKDCPDGAGVIGTDDVMMTQAINGEIPDLEWPFNKHETPSDAAIFDLIEFCFDKVGKPINGGFHSYFNHFHYDTFDTSTGQSAFRTDINRILSRNGLAYELNDKGYIVRIGAPILHEALSVAMFVTGDDILDSMLESARAKFLDPDIAINREALERLWDAWERLKTLEPSKDKKASVAPKFRELLEKEAFELTRIGNTHLIRHSETSQETVVESTQVDYLFHRLFSVIYFLLQSRSSVTQ
jgi:hypothetical protein